MHRRHLATAGLALALAILLPPAPHASGEEGETRLTVDHPVSVSLEPLGRLVGPGERSALLIHMTIPEGIWIGAAASDVRSPGPTVLAPESDACVQFLPSQWPEPRVEGIPVALGTTRVYTGRVTAVLPFETTSRCTPGEHRVRVRITYTPGLNAGHLTPHPGELHEASIEVVSPGAAPPARAVQPSVEPAAGLHVERSRTRLPRPLDLMLFAVGEDSMPARALHAIWEDPPHHGKEIQGAMHPYAATTKNNGSTWGAGAALLNTTRQGIGTAAVEMRVVHNEFAGTMGALDAVSCPAAFHNYQLDAFYAQDPTTRGARLHVENLTLAGGRFGYELQADGFRDGRFRFFGLGSGTQEDAESAYTNRELGGALDLFWNFATNWRLSAGGKVRRIRIEDPAERLARERPSTLSRYSQAPGLRGGTVAGERVTLVFDRRNQEFTPSRGTYVRLRAEIDHTVDDRGEDLAHRWGHFEALVRHYWSTPGQTLTLVATNRWEVNTNERSSLPFWEQSRLGGADSLRAFDEERFQGQNSVLGSVEVRIEALRMVVMGMPVDVEVAPFVDAGQVFGPHRIEGVFNVNPGLSLRVLNRPNIGLVANWAYGQDGGRFTGGVGLPF